MRHAPNQQALPTEQPLSPTSTSKYTSPPHPTSAPVSSKRKDTSRHCPLALRPCLEALRQLQSGVVARIFDAVKSDTQATQRATLQSSPAAANCGGVNAHASPPSRGHSTPRVAYPLRQNTRQYLTNKSYDPAANNPFTRHRRSYNLHN